MSANDVPKEFTKFPPDDEYTDSGFISGQISEQLLSSDNISNLNADDDNLGASCDEHKCVEDTTQLDSGLDLSESFNKVNISDTLRNNLDDEVPKTRPILSVITEQDLAVLFTQDDDGDTQLHIASVHGCQKSIATLLAVCPASAWINLRNDYGQTALHLAAACGYEVVARMLVLGGAALGIRDLSGENALHISAAAGNVRCLQALLAPVQGRPVRGLNSLLDQKNYNGQACVHIAAMAGHVEALQTLVYYGADINAREGLGGLTALHIAAARGNLRTLEYLMEKCVGVDIHARDYSGRTPRRLARAPHAVAVFSRRPQRDDESSDDDEDTSDYDDDMPFENRLNLFNKLKEGLNPINVA